MLLDLRTIYVVGATTTLILGFVHVIAYATGRFDRWPLWWGLSNLLYAFGIIAASFRGVIPDLVSIVLANCSMLAGCLLLRASILQFGGRPTPPLPYALLVLATGALFAAFIEPEHFELRVVLIAVLVGICDALIVRDSIRLAREEKLASGWILACLFAPSALFYFVRAGMALDGQLGGELFPSTGAPGQWMSVLTVSFMLMRSSVLVLLAAERNRNRLVALAREDALTGVMNRAGFAAALDQVTQASRRDGGRVRRVALLAVDIDHFKGLNDAHGHAIGDTVLRLFAETARRHLRDSDLIARQGGDEFAIMLPGTGSQDAFAIAERIRTAFAEEVGGLSLDPAATLSIGIAEGRLGRDTLDDLMRQADEALYRSKRLGRNRSEAGPALRQRRA